MSELGSQFNCRVGSSFFGAPTSDGSFQDPFSVVIFKTLDSLKLTCQTATLFHAPPCMVSHHLSEQRALLGSTRDELSRALFAGNAELSRSVHPPLLNRDLPRMHSGRRRRGTLPVCNQLAALLLPCSLTISRCSIRSPRLSLLPPFRNPIPIAKTLHKTRNTCLGCRQSRKCTTNFTPLPSPQTS